MIGIVIVEISEMSVFNESCMGVFIFLLSFSLLTKILWKWALYFIILCFILLGSYRQNQVNGNSSSYFIKESAEVLFVAKVIDLGNKKQWRKSVVEIQKVINGPKELRNKKSVLFVNKRNGAIKKGDILLIKTEIKPIKNKNNPGGFNAELYWKSKGVYSMGFVSAESFLWIDNQKPNILYSASSKVKSSIKNHLSKYLKKEYLGVSIAVLFGDKSIISEETTNSFSNAGAMHLLAVSGLHIGIIYMMLINFFSIFSKYISRNKALAISVLVLWAYALITGFSPSVTRAVFMFSMLGIAKSTSKPYNSFNVLFLTAFVLLLINPLYLFDIGFQLSYLAMLGIYLFYKPFVSLFNFKNSFLNWIWKGSILGVSAQLMTLPLTLYYFNSFPNYFILTNLGIMLLSGALLSLLMILLSIKYWPLLSRAISVLVAGVLFVLLYYIKWIEKLPGSVATGYYLSFSVAMFFLCSIVLLLKTRANKRNIFYFSFIYICILGYLVYNRHENINKQEVCIFNNSNFVMTVRVGNDLLCFYEGDKTKLKKAKFLARSYAKIHPGKLTYINVANKKIEIINDKNKIRIISKKMIKEILINNKMYKVLSRPQKTKTPCTVIYMPWIKEGNGHHLNKKAISIDLQ